MPGDGLVQRSAQVGDREVFFTFDAPSGGGDDVARLATMAAVAGVGGAGDPLGTELGSIAKPPDPALLTPHLRRARVLTPSRRFRPLCGVANIDNSKR